MMTEMHELQLIPGIGRSLADDLIDLEFHCVQDLQNADPDEMYHRLAEIRGHAVDRCVLYVFRCAVYYASNENHDQELLKWWNWKNRLR